MEAWERVQMIMSETGHNKNSFSEAIGLTNNVTITRLINEKRKPSKATIQKIVAAFPKYNLEWLTTGEGEKYNNESRIEAAIVPSTEENKGEFFVESSTGARFYDLGNGKYRMKVPLVPYCAYGRFANETDTLEPDKEEWDEESFEVNQIVHGNYLSFEVKGDSMDDGRRDSFEEGDRVLARELNKMHWKDGLRYNKYPYWVIVFDSSVLIKQIVDQDMTTGEITCHSLNPSPQYADFKLSLDEVRRLYNVVKKKPKDVDF